ncbi:hypothetical protein [Ekhidna sp.]|uniref:hypothetical protein n=1 Tax=Ekhidna sp. TaxID=2608089 RepID=UPI0032984463
MDETIKRIKSAVDSFILEDSELLEQDAHEASITGHLMEHLAVEFDDFEYNIDTQYNKMILENVLIKKEAEFLISSLPLNKWPENWEDDQERALKAILPDIIFHDRASSNENFIIIEVKKSTNKSKEDREWDILKLKEMTAGQLNYQFGVFIDFFTGAEFTTDNPYVLQLFQKGQLIM